MSVAPTSSATSPADPTDTQSRLPVKMLSQDDFLKLLVAQMTSQDPLNPKSDIDMIPQMVSFNELEQSKSMQTDIQNLRAEQQVLQANSLLGRTVQVQDGDHQVTGQVTAVQMEEGTPKLLVNGQRYDLGSLLSITPTPTGN